MLRTRFRTRARFIPALSGGGGFSITNSLRFNDNDSAYLSRTPSVAGNRKTWTWSGWVKRGNLGASQFLFGANSGAFVDGGLVFTASDTLGLSFGGNVYNKYTTSVLRDVSGWYHIVAVLQTDNATAANRIKLYVNGVEQTAYTTQNSGLPPSGYTPNYLNNANNHDLGKLAGYSQDYLDGYMAEINFIDGQALTPDDFGEIDETTGEWSPIAYAGTYGTNGFYLPFDGNSNDDSGNGNNWTENNLASTDYMIDTPTNNFAVLNPLVSGGGTLSQGNLVWTGSASVATFANSGFGVSSGKWYSEMTVGAIGFTVGFGIYSLSAIGTNNGTKSRGYLSTGEKYANGTTSAYGASFTTNDIIGMAVDVDAGTIEFFKNNTSQGVAFLDIAEDTWFVTVQGGSSSPSANMNFGADSSFAGNKTRQGNTDANGIGDFYYTPPTGYLALCTDNLPAPAIEQPETQFNVVLDTGANIKATAEALYDSSLIWIKDRANSNNHQLIDTVRGTGVLQSNTTAAETTYSAPSGNSVAWVWKAGGTAVSNTDGSITSQVSANVDSGFSIVSYTATNNSSNVGHGLSQAPELIIFKSRTSASSWPVYTTAIDGTYDYLGLNLTNAKGNSALTAPSSSVMYVNNTEFAGTNVGSNNYIAYAFHSVEGFSKFGSYVGNGSTNGPFVYTGFKPAFVMIKRADAIGNWTIFDNERVGYNPDNKSLIANTAEAEGIGSLFDLLSNGFKCRIDNPYFNASGGTYIFMAFAEHPFKEALAR